MNESVSSESSLGSKSTLGSKPSLGPKPQADVQSQLQQLSSAVEMLMKQQPGNASPVRKLPGALFEVFTELLDAEIDPVVARQLIEAAEQSCNEQQLADPWLIKGRISQWVQQQLKVANPLEVVAGQREIIALVGSTGVGKTTTLAKLAAGFHLQQGLSVGLITVDTFRMGAVDQLRGYAQIIDLPMEVVERPDQMPLALERLSDCPLILLDTTGRSPRDHEHLQYLSNLLSIARPTQVHLVVSATASPANLKATVEKFSIAKPTHMILTKLDEVGMLGGLLPFLQKGEFPLSYVTTGQNVPNDIQEANRRRLATMLLGQQSL